MHSQRNNDNELSLESDENPIIFDYHNKNGPSRRHKQRHLQKNRERNKPQFRGSSIGQATSIYTKQVLLSTESRPRSMIKHRKKLQGRTEGEDSLLKKLHMEINKRNDRMKKEIDGQQIESLKKMEMSRQYQQIDFRMSSPIEIVEEKTEEDDHRTQKSENKKKKKGNRTSNWRSKNILRLDVIKTIYYPKDKKSYKHLLEEESEYRQAKEDITQPTQNFSSLKVERRIATARCPNKNIATSLQDIDMVIEKFPKNSQRDRYHQKEQRIEGVESCNKISKHFTNLNFQMQSQIPISLSTRKEKKKLKSSLMGSYQHQAEHFNEIRISHEKYSPSQSSIQSDKKSSKTMRNIKSHKKSKAAPIQLSPKKSANQENQLKKKRTFVINSFKQNIITEYLRSLGWRQLCQRSQIFALKWSFNEQFFNYELLQRNNNRNHLSTNLAIGSKMYYNHLKNNMLVTKDRLHELVVDLQSSGIKTNTFIPKTYTLQQRDAFVKEYERNVLICLLENHREYLKIDKSLEYNQEQLQKILQKLCQICQSSYKKCYDSKIDPSSNQVYALIEYSSPYFLIAEKQNKQKLINLPLVFYTIVLCLQRWAYQQGSNSECFDALLTKICQDQKIMANLIKYSKAEIQIHQYHEMKFSHKRKKVKRPQQKNIYIEKGKIMFKNTFVTPSSFIISALTHLFSYFSYSKAQENTIIDTNIWILKPSAGSRGKGIQIVDRPEKLKQVLSQNPTSKIIQKYIENVWILDEDSVKKLSTFSSINQYVALYDEQEGIDKQKIPLRKHSLLNKKFDIRQWVLLIPPKSFIFSHFYLRICSQQYDMYDLEQLSSHLSNYSINKEDFKLQQRIQDSVFSEEDFHELLRNLKMEHNFFILKQKIKEKISLLVEEALANCKWIDGTFQLVGFDILIDKNLNPWVIECNMSPACDLRTHWLKQMRQISLKEALHLVMPDLFFNQNQAENEGSSKGQKTFYWQELPNRFSKHKVNNLQMQRGEIGELRILGKKISKKQK